MDGNNDVKKRSKRFLIIYCIAIFVFAAALILIASASQVRITREADAIKEKLNTAEGLAADKQTRLDAVMTENSRLNEQIKTLTSENENIKKLLEDEKNAKQNTEKSLAASKKLAELLNLKRQGKTKMFKAQLEAFEASGLEQFLDGSGREIYESIK